MLNVQVAKDTFYATLRDRVAAGNPARTVVVRGALRPGVVVSENELPGAAIDGIAPADAFCLRWTAMRVDTQGELPLLSLLCEIRYATDGTQGMAGMDRGRSLSTMDSELIEAVSASPQSAIGLTIAEIGGGGAVTQAATGSNVFWADVAFKPVVMHGERMERTAEVEVFAYGN